MSDHHIVGPMNHTAASGMKLSGMGKFSEGHGYRDWSRREEDVLVNEKFD